MSSEIIMGNIGHQYKDGQYQSVTFCLTEECNLRCKYCYMSSKNNFRRMSLETAKKAVDFILRQPTKHDAVAFEFIGGEPTLEIALMDQICDYIKEQLYLTGHKWFNDYMFSVCTNGVLYGTKEMQAFILKNKAHLSIGITIDGTKRKHDMQRVTKDGSGSYDLVAANIPLWQEQFPNALTKVTFASDDLPYLKESIIHLWDMGLKVIPANVVFEDVWKDGDAQVYEQQLKDLADYIIEKKLWSEYSVRFFDPQIGFPLSKADKQQNFCGAGKMIAIDCDGKLYPCIRFFKFCLPDDSLSGLPTGDIINGFDENKLAPFDALNIDIVNDGECKECSVASGCFACSGNNYSSTPSHTIFNRTKFNCPMHKAQIRANDYFWNKLNNIVADVTPRELARKRAYLRSGLNLEGAKYLQIILNENAPSYCYYEEYEHSVAMSQEIFDKAVEFADTNHMIPVYVGDASIYLSTTLRKKFHIRIDIPDRYASDPFEMESFIPVYTIERSLRGPYPYTNACILRISRLDIDKLVAAIKTLASIYQRINIQPFGVRDWNFSDVKAYEAQLLEIEEYVTQNNNFVSINVWDRSPHRDQNRTECTAGRREFAVLPNGYIYPCAGYYYNGLDYVGDVENGINVPDANLLDLEKAPTCKTCSVNSCKRCILLNTLTYGFPNIPAAIQCQIEKTKENLNKRSVLNA